jgi:hypothetical protein
MTSRNQAVKKSPVGRAKEFADKRLIVTLRAGTRTAISAVLRNNESMAELARDAIAREIARRLATEPKSDAVLKREPWERLDFVAKAVERLQRRERQPPKQELERREKAKPRAKGRGKP